MSHPLEGNSSFASEIRENNYVASEIRENNYVNAGMLSSSTLWSSAAGRVQGPGKVVN